jgi:hypothetical protein
MTLTREEVEALLKKHDISWVMSHNDIKEFEAFANDCLQLGIAEGERRERERLWNLIDSNINKDGNLSGYGWDQLAQNNGLVLACNLIMNEIRDKGSKDCGD